MGNSLFVQKKESWKNVLKKLKTINWSRTNPEWQNRAIVNGKLSKSSTNVTLTSNLIKQKLGLELTPREIEIEKLIGDRK
jgi:DNA sulfur modification protein DndB